MEATTPAYPTRLSDTQWETLAVYFAADSQLGRPRNTHLPAVVEAILYVLSAGSGACCRGSFRLGRPSLATFHPGATRAVGSAFTATYAGGVRLSRKRQQSPWVAIADTQSVPLGCLTHRAGDVDGGKRVKGRKRHLLVESMGLLLAVVVTAAKISDQQGLPPLWRPLQFQGGWFHRLGLWRTHAVRVGLGTLPLHAGSAGASPRSWFPMGVPALGGGAHLGLDFPVPEAQPG